jgi:hypothetical protein
LALEQPSTIARYAINVKINNLPADFYTSYLEKINAVTTADVQRVANKYFNGTNARFIVIGKGSDVIENLEKTGIPIKYFDREANPVDKPQFLKPIPEGMTASKILENYTGAIGGRKTLNGVKTIMTTVELTIEGAPFKPTGVMKSMAPNKEFMEISAGGMGVIMKQVFNGKSGYSEQQGIRKEMSDEEIEKKKAESGLFPEMYLNSENISLISLSPLNGTDVYKIQVNENSFRYYDSRSFLLVRTEEMREVQGQKIAQTTDLSKYKSIDGVMMPHTSTMNVGPQVIIYEVSEIKINDGVSKKDFK